MALSQPLCGPSLQQWITDFSFKLCLQKKEIAEYKSCRLVEEFPALLERNVIQCQGCMVHRAIYFHVRSYFLTFAVEFMLPCGLDIL
jgi:hypothetical protein